MCTPEFKELSAEEVLKCILFSVILYFNTLQAKEKIKVQKYFCPYCNVGIFSKREFDK
jgi:hypothetical protein